MQSNELTKITDLIRSVFGGIGDKDAMQAWHTALKDIPYDVAKQAVDEYISSEHFPPKPSDILERAGVQIKAQKRLAELNSDDLRCPVCGGSGCVQYMKNVSLDGLGFREDGSTRLYGYGRMCQKCDGRGYVLANGQPDTAKPKKMTDAIPNRFRR